MLNTFVKEDFRKNVFLFQEAISQLPQIGWEVEHIYSFGIYARKFKMQADGVVVGHIHKHETLNVMVSGECVVLSEAGKEFKKAGDVWVSDAGSKRIVYSKTEIVWMTIHQNPSNTRNVGEIESELIAASYDDVALPMELKSTLMIDDSNIINDEEKDEVKS